jgi:hypothetical protein
MVIKEGIIHQNLMLFLEEKNYPKKLSVDVRGCFEKGRRSLMSLCCPILKKKGK